MFNRLLNMVTHKDNFRSLEDYINFAAYSLDYIETNKQATIVAQNENIYCFYQYNREANFRITRPFNSNILYNIGEFESKSEELIRTLNELKNYRAQANIPDSDNLNRSVYTIQQSIGFALDGLPARQTNTARKLNGDYFENLILILMKEIGLEANSGVVRIPINVENEELFHMNYQHDLILTDENSDIKLIGSVKTTSKDRIDKIFMDKFLYCKLTDTALPHIAIFLHDVQRKNTHTDDEYSINGTFLSGHFKGYTVKLNPLDGVYYLDPRPNMSSDVFLSRHIQTFDKLLCNDIWNYID